MNAPRRSEYQVEYCDMYGKRKIEEFDAEVVTCTKDLDEQPVGGRVAAAYQRRMAEEAARLRALGAEVERKRRTVGPPYPDMPVPDVHKLRYMSNDYMTPDDWYGTISGLENTTRFTL